MHWSASVRFLLAFAFIFAGTLLPAPAARAETVAPSKSVPPKLPPLELPVPESVLKQQDRLWYGIYMSGTKIGWGVETTGPGVLDGEACIVHLMEMKMEMKTLSNVMKMDMTLRHYFSREAPHRALLIESSEKMDGQERTVAVRHKEGTTYTALITEAERSRFEPVADFDYRLTHVTTPAVWAAGPQRKPGDVLGSVDFSTDKLVLSAGTATVLQEAEWVGPGGKLPVWEISDYDHLEKMTVLSRASRSSGSLVQSVFSNIIEIRLEPEKVATQLPGDDQPDIFLSASIPSDKKLGSPDRLSGLVVEISAPEGTQVPEIPDTVNQTVERHSAGRVTVRLTPGKGRPQPASAEERQENLKATVRYPIGQQIVKDLAEKAAGTAADERKKVENILRFTDSYIRDTYEIEALSVMDIIRNRKGECSAHALLFTALARAAGIPAREAGGWMYMGNQYQSFGGHAWNEVVLDGHWVPVDAVFRQMTLDASHIQQHAGESEASALGLVTGGLKAKVISSEKR